MSGSSKCVGFVGHRPDRLGRWGRFRLPRRLGRLFRKIEIASGPAKPTLHSGLADGADFLATATAVERGWGVHVILPYPVETLLSTYDDLRRRQRVENLLSKVDELTIIEDPHAPEGAFVAAGNEILDRVSLLVAVHDRGESNGAGGTHDIMKAARSRGLTVIELTV